MYRVIQGEGTYLNTHGMDKNLEDETETGLNEAW